MEKKADAPTQGKIDTELQAENYATLRPERGVIRWVHK